MPALVIGQSLVLSSCKKDKSNHNDEPPTNEDEPYISDDCLSCGSCQQVCQANAIMEGDGHYQIDPAKCVWCGDCVKECPLTPPSTSVPSTFPA